MSMVLEASRLSRYADELKTTGSTLIPMGVVFDASTLKELERLQSLLPEEAVTQGDAGDTHDIYVRRIMVDRQGEVPQVVNRPHADQILDILNREECRNAIAELFQSQDAFHIRRAQMNRMTAGSFIGLHLDAASNPDYDYSMIIQLGHDFAGGDFVVHDDAGARHAYAATYGTVLLTTCKLRHEVARVTAGERNALVYFYSRHDGANRRHDA
ncbi:MULTISPECIES: 2OG-Fe(II) oxygenase family protein [Stenotrophomonas]|uniref:2OG-Fe(II) oxygenase n=1 Tax=Stenotrophomonas maltophilia TaxID=40324 RepID=A0AAI9C0Q5_STEMA|nr:MULTISPECIES: 2OG-Fe(II) oxygenase [Stenotrophomonas]UUS14513.1 2OG-Fe(II) oxygenase [Stenotrophomonas sp. CD2]AWT15873.1 2OG-Fe(II) oxygenase [Stenotrophomonas maltophilia]EKT4091999.1 2OG-Fe(II) oxygenase [Stenotrophomonas maltophilia]ELF4101775.1 2OG-Fe(II) oxygenase [Stenotrophomonas maltophilia]MBA0287139.1 2OG-Fe(II) oxygenase [Stenotrophomonas maltophilia]